MSSHFRQRPIVLLLVLVMAFATVGFAQQTAEIKIVPGPVSGPKFLTKTEQALETVRQGQIMQTEGKQPTFVGEPISLDLVNVDLIDFFRIVSELSGLNVIIDPDVKGTITIHVENVPWDQVFETVLRSHRLQKTIEGNVVRISTQKTLQTEAEDRAKLQVAAFNATELVTMTRRLNYAKAADLEKPIKEQLTRRGQFNFDLRSNTLIIKDVGDQVRVVNALIDTLDLAEPQVEIEARVIEATTTFSRDIGIQFDLVAGNPFRDRVSTAGSVVAPIAIDRDRFGALGIRVGNLIDTFQLDLAISAAEAKGDARILSKPRVSAQNNKEALITQGQRIPIPVTQNFTTTVRFEDAALKLRVTPQITDQGTVLLKLKVENNIPDFSVTVLGIPIILTSESETEVLVANGGTTVIGGIYIEQDRNREDRVPGLGSLPVVGHLFKRSLKQRDTREILFFITPRIKQ